MPIKTLKVIVQEDPTGCGIACAAMLAGKSYHAVKKQAKKLGIFPDDTDLRSDIGDLRNLLDAYNIRIGKQQAFHNWQAVPSPAIIATKHKNTWELASWHWAVFHRAQNGPTVLDPTKRLKTNIRTDLGNLKPQWYVPITSA